MNGIIAVVSGKGGTGKTTSALAIAGALKTLGMCPSAVIDRDRGASMTRSYSYEPSEPVSEQLLNGEISFESALHETDEGIMLIPASASLSAVERSCTEPWRDRLTTIARDNLLIIDTSDNIMSAPVAAAILAADILAIPVSLMKIDYESTFAEIWRLLEAAGHSPEIMWFATDVDQRTALAKHMLQTIAEDGVDLAALIPRGIAISEAQLKSMSIVGAAPKSKSGRAYVELGRKIYARLRKLRGAKPGVHTDVKKGDPICALVRNVKV